MKLPPDFAFSQHNLQDFVDCPRRFELRYLTKLAWPAVRSEPVLEVERHMQLGERFHRMVQQHQSGISAEWIEASANEPELVDWWQAYQTHAVEPLPQRRWVEYTLTAPYAGYRLVVKYDLLAVDPGQRAVIVDWKTRRSILTDRLQTRLYPFLLALAGKGLNQGDPIEPAQIELTYWFTSDPANPEHFPYSSEQFIKDKRYLEDLISRILAAIETGFPLTTDLKRCKFCNYRSLCDRGAQAAEMLADAGDEDETAGAIDLDYEQVGEISY